MIILTIEAIVKSQDLSLSIRVEYYSIQELSKVSQKSMKQLPGFLRIIYTDSRLINSSLCLKLHKIDYNLHNVYIEFGTVVALLMRLKII